MRIDFRRLAAAVTEDFLNISQIRAVFKQMDGKTVPQGVNRCRLFDACLLQGCMKYLLNAFCRVFPAILTLKQIRLRIVLCFILFNGRRQLF